MSDIIYVESLDPTAAYPVGGTYRNYTSVGTAFVQHAILTDARSDVQMSVFSSAASNPLAAALVDATGARLASLPVTQSGSFIVTVPSLGVFQASSPWIVQPASSGQPLGTVQASVTGQLFSTVSVAGAPGIVGSVWIGNTPSVVIAGQTAVTASVTGQVFTTASLAGVPAVVASVVGVATVTATAWIANTPSVLVAGQPTVSASVTGQLFVTASVAGQVFTTASMAGVPTFVGSVQAQGQVASGTAWAGNPVGVGALGADYAQTSLTQVGCTTMVPVLADRMGRLRVAVDTGTLGVTGTVGVTQSGSFTVTVPSLAVSQSGSFTVLATQANTAAPFTVIVTSQPPISVSGQTSVWIGNTPSVVVAGQTTVTASVVGVPSVVASVIGLPTVVGCVQVQGQVASGAPLAGFPVTVAAFAVDASANISSVTYVSCGAVVPLLADRSGRVFVTADANEPVHVRGLGANGAVVITGDVTGDHFWNDPVNSITCKPVHVGAIAFPGAAVPGAVDSGALSYFLADEFGRLRVVVQSAATLSTVASVIGQPTVTASIIGVPACTASVWLANTPSVNVAGQPTVTASVVGVPTVTGSIRPTPYNATIATSRIIVSASGTPLPTTALASRGRVIIYNRGMPSTPSSNAIVYVGPTGVSSNGGWPIDPGGVLNLELGPGVALFGCTVGSHATNINSGQEIALLEIA